jgi:ribosome maturation factor RimP
MPRNSLAERLTGLLEPTAVAHGLLLVNVEVSGAARTPLVRVFLDREGGIDIETITASNAWIKEVLDALPETADTYSLEVSSPGIERTLRTPADFERFAGSQVKVTTDRIVEGRKHFTGTLNGLVDGAASIEVDGTVYAVPLDAMDTARLRVDIDFAKEGLDGI